MDLIHVIVLALIQGVTEFLPISSSAHLILPKALLGWPDQGLAFDVAVHVGTLCAVMVYFRQDIVRLTFGWCNSVVGKGTTENGRLAWLIIGATIPASLCGLAFNDIIENHLRSMAVIATTTIIFGIVLALADRKGQANSKSLLEMTLIFALVIGAAQALALIPGTSRSGITITAALFLGFSRVEAARFSFLLSIPIIILSGSYKGLGLIGEASVDWFAMLVGIAVSALSAYLCIHYFLSFINRLSMMPFVVYRLVLGLVLVVIIV
ncbi:MAG: undecaprenyl-diphosphatase [Lentisphaeria bacterium]|jgi:undecaprenyl-diphosphatase